MAHTDWQPSERPALREHELSQWHEESNARIYAGYLLLQALVGIAQWAIVAQSETFRSWFEVLEHERDVVNAFAIADLVVIVASLISAWAVGARRPWAPVAVAFTAASLIYPTAWLVGWVAYTDTGNNALLLMIAPTSITTWLAVRTWKERPR